MIAYIDEAVVITTATLAVLEKTAPGVASTAKAQLLYQCGKLAAGAGFLLDVPQNEIPGSAFWSEFAACFDQARIAGATYETMDAIRTIDLTFNPVYNLGAAVSNFIMRMTLAEQAMILAAQTFASRSEIDNYITLITASFDAAIEIAADNMDNAVYMSLIRLESAAVTDLATRAAPLPIIVTATFPRRLPALLIAQKLYQDPTEAAAIIAMNKISHPAFCPASLQVLSFGSGS